MQLLLHVGHFSKHVKDMNSFSIPPPFEVGILSSHFIVMETEAQEG